MRPIAFMAVMAGLVLCGCSHRKVVDETVECDRYTLHIQDLKSWNTAHDRDVKWISYFSPDTVILSNSMPEMALYLASMTQGPRLDSTTMWYIDVDKQRFLPCYVYTLVDHDDATCREDYTPLLQALIERGLLCADTTYEPMQLLELCDTARYNDFRRVYVDSSDLQSVSVLVVQLRSAFRVPLALAPEMDSDMLMEMHYDGKNRSWEQDSVWLGDHGLRIVPDPQGRKLRVVTFNRAKGRI